MLGTGMPPLRGRERQNSYVYKKEENGSVEEIRTY